jgi:4-hydroxyphenylpyruvate dioxygenase
MTAFGFQALAYAGPETGCKDFASYAIRQHKLTFVLTTPLHPDNPMADHIYRHGDGVKALALRVPDARAAWQETTARGAKSYLEPVVKQDAHGEAVISGIHTYGDTVHLFIERKNYTGAFLPGTGVDRATLCRSLCRQCWLESNEYVGEILRRGDGLQEHSLLR